MPRFRFHAGWLGVALLVWGLVVGGWTARVYAQVAEGNADRDGTRIPRFPLPLGRTEIANGGTARVTIPLSVPPGVRGMEPRLVLQYQSGSPDQGLGPGWSLQLDVPLTLEHSPRFGVPHYDDRDTFTYAGQDLVATGQTHVDERGRRGLRYRTRIDQYLRIVRYSDSWSVWRPDGVRLEYGISPSGRSQVGAGRVYAWHLQRVVDPMGNTLILDWTGPAHRRYLARMAYTLDAAGRPIAPLQEVVFHWTARPDPRRDYRYGGAVVLGQRLQSIETRSGGRTVRWYAFCYEDQACSGAPPDPRGITRLARVTERGADGTTLPPHRFRYQERRPGWTEAPGLYAPWPFTVMWEDPHAPSPSLVRRVVEAGVRLVDVNGDGRVDLVRANPATYRDSGHQGEVYLYREDGPGPRWQLDPTWAVPYQLVTTNFNNDSLDTGVRLLDVNGDGLADFLMASSLGREVRLNNGHGWDPPGTYRLPDGVAFVVNNGVTSRDLGVRFADVNGDGLPDLLQASRADSTKRVYLNNGRTGWDPAPAGQWEIPRDIDFVDPDAPLTADTGVRLVDINHDGLVDIVRAYDVEYNGVRDRTREVWINTGAGWTRSDWSFPIGFYLVRYTSGTGWLYYDLNVQLVDLNGDGYPDVLFSHHRPENRAVYLNDQHGGFVYREDWPVPVPFVLPWRVQGVYVINGDGGVRVADVNGDNLADLVVAHLFLDRRAGSFTTYLAHPGVADLLVEYINPLGGRMTFTYSGSSGLGQAPGEMPFVRTVARSMVLEPGTGDPVVPVTVTFSGGRYDAGLREFLGFRSVVEVRGDGTRRERTYYVDPPRTGWLQREVLRDDDGLRYRETVREVKYRALGGGAYRTWAAAETRIQAHQDNPYMAVKRRVAWVYDEYGNPIETRETDWGRSGAVGQVRRSVRVVYAVNETAWILRTPARIERYAGDLDRLVSVETRYYDGFRQPGAVTRGLLTRRDLRDLRLESRDLRSGSAVQVITYRYDRYGNPVERTIGGRFVTRWDYAGNGYRFPYTETRVNPAGPDLTRTTVYDLALGVRLREIGYNGETTLYTYDGLGRWRSLQYPDDPPGDPSIRVRVYRLDRLPVYRELWMRLEPGRVRVRREYFDGLGRPRAVVRGQGRQWVVTDFTRYDDRGRVAERFEPFYRDRPELPATGPAAKRVGYQYEDDRVARVTYPDGSQVVHTYTADGVATRDENGHTVYRRYDAFGSLVEVRDAVGRTYYEYDGLGRLRRARDPGGRVTAFLFDARGNLRGISSPDGRQTPHNGFQVWIDYNDLDRPTYHWSGTAVWRVDYDAVGRPHSRYVSGDGGRTWYLESLRIYDDTSLPNGRGRLVWLVNASGLLSWTRFRYDVRGRVIEETHYYRYLSPDLARVVLAFAYDGEDRMIAVRDPLGRWIRYQRDPLGRIRAIARDEQPVVRWMEHDAAGRITRLVYGHEIEDRFVYDARGRMTAVDGTGPLQIDYRYDAEGNLIEERARDGSWVLRYAYDGVHRLASFRGQWGASRLTLSYVYDTSGNLVRVQAPEPWSVEYRYEPGSNRLAGVEWGDGRAWQIRLDEHGNLVHLDDGPVGAETRDYTYDPLQRLIRYSTGKGTGEIVYDGRDRRIRVMRPGGGYRVYFYGPRGKVLAVWDRSASGPAWLTYIVADGRRVARVDATGAIQYLHRDRLDSLRAITVARPRRTGCFDVDLLERTGKRVPIPCPPEFARVWAGDYLPFGAAYRSAGGADAFRFTDQEFLADAGVYHFGARVYDPRLRRFLQPDRFLGIRSVPQTLNRYVYNRNNPLRFVDPTGNQPQDVEKTRQRLQQQVADAALHTGLNLATEWLVEDDYWNALRNAHPVSHARATGRAIRSVSTLVSMGLDVGLAAARGEAAWKAVGAALVSNLVPMGGFVLEFGRSVKNVINEWARIQRRRREGYIYVQYHGGLPTFVVHLGSRITRANYREYLEMARRVLEERAREKKKREEEADRDRWWEP